MIVNVDFVFHASVLGRRQSSPRDHHYLASEPVEIREIDPTEAPMALRTRTNRLREGERVREYRRFEDALWLPMERGPNRTLDMAAIAEDASVAADVPYGHGNLFAAQSEYHYPLRGRIEDDPQAVRVVYTNLDERRAAVRAAASEILLVGGIAHRKAVEPVYQVSESGQYAFVYVEGYNPPMPKDDAARNFGRDHYRADEAAYMMGRHPVDAADRNVIEVIDPEALRAPLAEREMLVAARLLRERLGELALLRDVAFFSVYAALRDAEADYRARLYEAEAARIAPPSGEALSDAVRAGARALEAIEPGERTDFRVEWAEKALERMERRDLAAIPAFGSP